MLRKPIIIFLVLVSSVALAQPGDPGGDPGNVPITGIEILIGMGALFGIKKLTSTKKDK